jgi:acyl carrier protein
MTDAAQPAAVLAVVRQAIYDIIEVDGASAHAVPIERDTAFHEDLELESIELVALAERLQEHFGERVDFVGWVAHKELDEIIALRVGALVDYICQCLA